MIGTRAQGAVLEKAQTELDKIIDLLQRYLAIFKTCEFKGKTLPASCEIHMSHQYQSALSPADALQAHPGGRKYQRWLAPSSDSDRPVPLECARHHRQRMMDPQSS